MPRAELDHVALAYAAYARRSVDDEEARAAMTEDYRFHMRPGWPGRSSYGLDELPTMWADLDETFSGFELVPEEYAETADGFLVRLTTSTRMPGSDDRVEMRFYHLWRFREGKLAETRAFGTQEEAERHGGLDGAVWKPFPLSDRES